MSNETETAVAWELINKRTKLGKIANNLENHGGHDVTAFTVPFEDMEVLGADMCAMTNDKYFDRCVFNKTGKTEGPCKWLLEVEPLKLSETFHEAFVVITVSGDRDLEFDEVVIKDLSFKFDPKIGAKGLLSGKLYLRPGIGKENLILQEHQHRPVVITITNAKVMLKAKSKQIDAFEPNEESAKENGAAAQDEERKPRRKRANGEASRAH